MVGQAQVLPGSRSGSTFMIRGLCLPCYDPSLPPLSAHALNRVSNFAFVQPGPPPVLRILVIDVGPTDDPVPGVQAVLRVGAQQGLDATFPVGDTVALTAKSQGELEVGAALALLPPADLRLVQPNVEISGKVRLGAQASHTAGAPPIVILGVAGGTRIQAERARVAVG